MVIIKGKVKQMCLLMALYYEAHMNKNFSIVDPDRLG